ncbi:MAG: MBL fold metallo-hydrolase [Syntrophaceae bacterium]
MIEFSAHASSSAGNLYRVDGLTSLLLECGLPIKKIKQALYHQLHTIEACLLTHEHGDHAKAARDIVGVGVDLYCSAGTASALEIDCHHRVHIVEPLKAFKIGPWTVIPFDVEHDAEEPLGFLIINGTDRLLFAADTAFIRHRFAGLTMIALECNYSKTTMAEDIPLAHKLRVMRSHMSLDSVLAFLAANDLRAVRQIWALHLSRENSDAQLFKDKIQAATGIPTYIAPE